LIYSKKKAPWDLYYKKNLLLAGMQTLYNEQTQENSKKTINPWPSNDNYWSDDFKEKILKTLL